MRYCNDTKCQCYDCQNVMCPYADCQRLPTIDCKSVMCEDYYPLLTVDKKNTLSLYIC